MISHKRVVSWFGYDDLQHDGSLELSRREKEREPECPEESQAVK